MAKETDGQPLSNGFGDDRDVAEDASRVSENLLETDNESAGGKANESTKSSESKEEMQHNFQDRVTQAKYVKVKREVQTWIKHQDKLNRDLLNSKAATERVRAQTDRIRSDKEDLANSLITKQAAFKVATAHHQEQNAL